MRNNPRTLRAPVVATDVNQDIARQYDLSKLPNKTEQSAWNSYLDWVSGQKGYSKGSQKSLELNKGENQFDALSNEYNTSDYLGKKYDDLLKAHPGSALPSRDEWVKARQVNPEMIKNSQGFYKQQTKKDNWFGSETAQSYYPEISGMASAINPKNLEEMKKVNEGNFMAPVYIKDYLTKQVTPYKGVTKLQYDTNTGNPIIDYKTARDYVPADSSSIYVNPELNISAKQSFLPYTNPSTSAQPTVVGRYKGGKITKAPKRYANGTDTEGVETDASGKLIGYSRPVPPVNSTQNIGGNINATAIGLSALSGVANGLPSDVMNDPRFQYADKTNPMTKGLAVTGGNAVGTAIGIPGLGTAIGAGLTIKDAATNKLSDVNTTTGEYKSKNQAYGAGAIDSVFKMTPLGMVNTALDKDKTLGEKALSLGTFGISDAIQTKRTVDDKENANVGVIASEKQQAEAKRQAEANALKLQQQLQEREAGYSQGGKIVGKGTGTSDSILAKVKGGSFIVPAKNSEMAEEVREKVLNHKKMMKAPSMKKADLNQNGGEMVKLSNGEHMFSPSERKEIISKLGEEFLEALAPDAENESEEMREGGLTAGKARKILHDGTIRGKAITDKQRKYFGAISNGYKCGGDVKGYADGTDTEGVKGDTERERIEKQKLANEKEAKYYKELEKQKEIQLKKLEIRKEIEREKKYNKDVYDAAKKQYDDYSSKLKENPLQKRGIRDFSSTSTPALALKRKDELLKKQEELLNNLDKAEEKYKNSESKYKASQKDDSFNPDGTLKEAGIKKMTAPKTMPTSTRLSDAELKANEPGKRLSDEELSNAPVKTGAQIEKAMGVKTAPRIGLASEGRNSKYIAPTGETSQTEVPEMVTKATETKPTKEQSDLVTSAVNETINPTKTGGGNNQDLTKLGIGAAQQIGGLANYILPYKQYQMGKDYLAKSGARPVDKIDPEFQNVVTKAQANAQYGYTPEEQALLDQRNINALRSGQAAAQNYSGGSAGNAINLSRQASNDYFSRGLQSAISSKNLQMDKQAQANDLVNQKAAMQRQLFGDTMNAWQQNQKAGGDLVSAGLQNLMGANRLNREQQFQNKYAQNDNIYTQDYLNSLG